MSIQVTDLRPGVTIELDKQVLTVVEYNHIKMGRGGAIIRVKLKNMESGNTLEKTFKSGEKVDRAHIERKQMQFLYSQQGTYHFMDQETFEQIELIDEAMGDSKYYVKEGDVIQINTHEGRIIGIELPTSVTLKVSETGSGFKGDSVSNVMKPATLETGLVTQVPLFVNVDDSIVVDSRSGRYVERAK